MNMLPAAVIFDMDGVLVDSEPLHAESYVRAFAEVGVKLTVEEYRQIITLQHSTVRELLVSRGGDMSDWRKITKVKSEHFRSLMGEDCELRPGILCLLQSLQDAKIPTAIATSAGLNTLSVVMDNFEIRSYFDHIVTWEDVNAIKPDPAGFIIAAQKLGVKCGDCVVIEDSPRGVLAASRAGMKCVAVPTRSTVDGDLSYASLVVDSPADVNLALLRGLFE